MTPLHNGERTERITALRESVDAEVADIMANLIRSGGIDPLTIDEESRNPFRPRNLAGIIGQAPAKALLAAAIDSSKRTGKPLDHILLVGPSGMGKTTFATAVANEVGGRVYHLEAPISHDTLLALRDVMHDGDVLLLDEIHQQGIAERRGRESSTQPEVLFAVMEDRTLPTATGILPYPAITLIGATTDEGRLPDAFINRFPLQPMIVEYNDYELAQMVSFNARVLDRTVTDEAALMIARASRGVPREVNNLMRIAALQVGDPIGSGRVTATLNLLGIMPDGLTRDMVAMLRFLYERGGRTLRGGEVRYQASVNTIATAIGKSRDCKAISLRVEPHLIKCGYVQVVSGGRMLSDAGIKRAKELVG